MKTITKRVFAIAGVLALGLTAVKAQSDGALLDALVKKGVLSDQEAEDVRASEAKDYATTPAGKLSISDHITQLKLYGDARMRFEYLDEKPQGPGFGGINGKALGPDSSTTDRSRYRIRIGADYTFTDNLKAGFELESATASDSANQSFGSEFGKFSINVGLVYLQWKPTDWLTLTGGKQRNPIYTTDLVWDPDINPEGGSEVASFHPFDNLTVGVTGGQFVYADNNDFTNTSNVRGGTNGTLLNNSDIWMFVEQIPVQYNFNKDTYIKEVPGFTSYMGGGNTAVGTSSGDSVAFSSPKGTDNLQIFTAPGEVDWKWGDIPVKAYWDFALNTQGHDRVQDVYLGNGQPLVAVVGSATSSANTAAGIKATQHQNRDLTDNVAWLAGLQVGQNKKKGDWSIKGDFRQIGLGSVDPNLNDSDFGDSYLNQQGIRIQSQYNFTDFVTGSVTFFDTWAYKDNLMNGSRGENPSGLPLAGNSGVGGTTAGPTGNGALVTGTTAQTANLVGIHDSKRVQVDLQWKF